MGSPLDHVDCSDIAACGAGGVSRGPKFALTGLLPLPKIRASCLQPRMVPMFEIFTKLRTLFASRNPWPQPERLNPWLDRADAPREILAQLQRGEIDADTARQLAHWHEKGYIVLPNVIDDTRIDRVLNDFEQ